MSRFVHRISSSKLNQSLIDYLRERRLTTARKLFDESPNSRNLVSWNIMINGYVKNDYIDDAHFLFDEMPQRDIVSWNTILTGLHNRQDSKSVIHYFLQMLATGLMPSESTLSTVLTTLLNTSSVTLASQIHLWAISLALNHSVFVGSALMRVYANVRDYSALHRVFHEIHGKDVTSWNALILGCLELGYVDDAEMAFRAMPDKNIVSWTTLVSGYIINNQMKKASSIFRMISEKNSITWNVMISGYVQKGMFFEALDFFYTMLKSSTKPNEFTFSSALDACAGCSAFILGRQIHSILMKHGTPWDAVLFNSLLDMYVKCGDFHAGYGVFECIPYKNVVSWNAVIGGYAKNGLGFRALMEFDRMVTSGTQPNGITFVHVLWACAHGGLVEQGEKHFGSMWREYGICPTSHHYACMVDLYGRAGEVEKAYKVIEEMPIEPDVVIWGALLGACGLHSSLELAELAARGISDLERNHPAAYTVLSEIHGGMGAWNKVMGLREMMKKKNAKKQKAGSWKC